MQYCESSILVAGLGLNLGLKLTLMAVQIGLTNSSVNRISPSCKSTAANEAIPNCSALAITVGCKFNHRSFLSPFSLVSSQLALYQTFIKMTLYHIKPYLHNNINCAYQINDLLPNNPLPKQPFTKQQPFNLLPKQPFTKQSFTNSLTLIIDKRCYF